MSSCAAYIIPHPYPPLLSCPLLSFVHVMTGSLFHQQHIQDMQHNLDSVDCVDICVHFACNIPLPGPIVLSLSLVSRCSFESFLSSSSSLRYTSHEATVCCVCLFSFLSVLSLSTWIIGLESGGSFRGIHMQNSANAKERRQNSLSLHSLCVEVVRPCVCVCHVPVDLLPIHSFCFPLSLSLFLCIQIFLMNRDPLVSLLLFLSNANLGPEGDANSATSPSLLLFRSSRISHTVLMLHCYPVLRDDMKGRRRRG